MILPLLVALFVLDRVCEDCALAFVAIVIASGYCLLFAQVVFA